MTLTARVHRTLSGVTGQEPEGFAYDTDGNLTTDGHLTYEYDAENRLIAVS